MAVGAAALDGEGGGGGAEGLVAEQAPQGFDLLGGPVREVGEGAFADLAALTPSLAQEDGGGRVPVGDPLDVHGN